MSNGDVPNVTPPGAAGGSQNGPLGSLPPGQNPMTGLDTKSTQFPPAEDASSGRVTSGQQAWMKQFQSVMPGMTVKDFKKFMQGLEKFMENQMKQEAQEIKKANRDLKKSEEGN